jgi:hypothetical protein
MDLAHFTVWDQFVQYQRVDFTTACPKHHQDDDFEFVQANGLFR